MKKANKGTPNGSLSALIWPAIPRSKEKRGKTGNGWRRGQRGKSPGEARPGKGAVRGSEMALRGGGGSIKKSNLRGRKKSERSKK